MTGFCAGCAAHRTAILKAVAWIDYDFIFGLSVAIEAGFAVLDITFWNSGIIVARAARGTGARRIFAVTSLAFSVIRLFATFISCTAIYTFRIICAIRTFFSPRGIPFGAFTDRIALIKAAVMGVHVKIR